MNAYMKRALLTTIFGSAALLAACDRTQHETPAPHQPAPHYRIEAEVRGAAAEAFAARGDNIVQARSCYLNGSGSVSYSPESCAFDIETAQDDGLVHAVEFHPADNSIREVDCTPRDDSPVADDAMKRARADFTRDALEKADKLGLTLLGTHGEDSGTRLDDKGVCRAFTEATVTVKLDGHQYTSLFREEWRFPHADASGITTRPLEPVSDAAEESSSSSLGHSYPSPPVFFSNPTIFRPVFIK